VTESAALSVATYDVLFVVASSSGLTFQETLKMSQLLQWNFTVHTIPASASQSIFNVKLAVSRCVFVGEDIESINLDNKLSSVTNGIVLEENALVDEFNIAPGFIYANSNSLTITNKTHYILSFLPSSTPTTVQVFHNTFMMSSLKEVWAPGLNILGGNPNRNNNPALVTIQKGGTLLGGNVATGRLVLLPWGDFYQDFANLNDNGLTIMRRSLQWAMGTGSD
jgi:hypothetical protein